MSQSNAIVKKPKFDSEARRPLEAVGKIDGPLEGATPGRAAEM